MTFCVCSMHRAVFGRNQWPWSFRALHAFDGHVSPHWKMETTIDSRTCWFVHSLLWRSWFWADGTCCDRCLSFFFLCVHCHRKASGYRTSENNRTLAPRTSANLRSLRYIIQSANCFQNHKGTLRYSPENTPHNVPSLGSRSMTVNRNRRCLGPNFQC